MPMNDSSCHFPDYQEARRRVGEKTVIDRTAMDLPEEVRHTGDGLTYALRTYGCQANFHESEMIGGIMEEIGFSRADFDHADVVLINTCAIRENAEDKVYGEIGVLKHQKESGRKVVIGIGGCMMQQPGSVAYIRRTWPEVDLIYGTHNMVRLPYLLYDVIHRKEKKVEVYSVPGRIYENIPIRREASFKAYVEIMDGCDKFCTYCVVPYTRGRQRSRLEEDILKEVRSLRQSGCREVMLLGQNVNAYGKDLEDSGGFARLLEKVSDTGIDRIRFMTSHPWDFTDEMVRIAGERDNIMPYFHLPVQSGSDRILKRMGRRYTAEEYRDLVAKLREAKKGCALSTDIIVGFPSETEEDFQKTLDLYEEIGFDSAFTFAYSPRPGTPAAEMDGQIPEEVKAQRLQRLNEAAARWGSRRNRAYEGKIVRVLAEGPSKKDPAAWSGYTPTMKLVNFLPAGAQRGEIVDVRIEQARSWTLNGKQV